MLRFGNGRSFGVHLPKGSLQQIENKLVAKNEFFTQFPLDSFVDQEQIQLFKGFDDLICGVMLVHVLYSIKG